MAEKKVIPKTSAKLTDDWRRSVSQDNTRTSPKKMSPAPKPVNTTSEFLFTGPKKVIDTSKGRLETKVVGGFERRYNPNAQMGLINVSPEFELLSMGGGFASMLGKKTAKAVTVKSATTKETASAIQKFKSEIDWGNWNREIPENKSLIQEYHLIEQQAKSNGSWMKNADGSLFDGTPEQFVQENSVNFKKAFKDGSSKTYRGDNVHYPELDYNPVFTGDKQVASYYAPDNGSFWGPHHQRLSKANVLDNTSGGMHELYYNPKRLNIKIDADGQDYIGKFIDNRGIVHRSTDDIASNIAVGENDAIITNIYDGAPYKGTVRIINHNYGSNNFMKSARGNNGMFDMSNPNIYKSIIPVATIGTMSSKIKRSKNKQN